MNPRTFLEHIDEPRLVAAIVAAERRTSGEIRVFISQRRLKPGGDIIAHAARHFEKLGMTATRERNGVLIYLMPLDQNFAIIGDRGIHEKCGPSFWEEVSAGMTRSLAAGTINDAIITAISQIGDILALHFPHQSDDRDELGNEILND